MEIRLAFPNEVDAIMQVIEEAKKCLAEAGSTQWQNGYPNADTIIEDIISGQAYVALDEGELLAYAAVTNTQLFSKSNLVHCLLTVDFKTFFSSPRITS